MFASSGEVLRLFANYSDTGPHGFFVVTVVYAYALSPVRPVFLNAEKEVLPGHNDNTPPLQPFVQLA
jgi:hypothetical protein